MAWQRRVFGNHPKVLRIMSLLSGVCCILIVGCTEGFSAYANSIKYQYNLTQVQVDALSGLSFVGVSLGFPSAFVMEMIGIPATMSLALGLTVGSSLLLWSTTWNKVYYSQNFYLMPLYFFTFGLGSMFSYMIPLAVNISNFSSHNRGKVISLLDSSFNSGAVLLVLIFFQIFLPEPSAVDSGDLSAYFLFQTCFCAVCILGAIIFTNKYRSDEEEEAFIERLPFNVEDEDTEPAENLARIGLSVEFSWKDLLTSLDFHLIAWGFILFTGVSMTYRSNVTIFLKSIGYSEYSQSVALAQPAIGFVSSNVVGALSDYLLPKCPRSAISMISVSICVTLMCMALFLINNIAFFIVLSCILLAVDGLNWALTPTLLSDYFGEAYFNRSWGIVTFGASLASLVNQTMFGALYKYETYMVGSTQCYGAHCYRYIIMGFIASITVTLVCYMVLFFRASGSRARRQEYKLLTADWLSKKTSGQFESLYAQ